MVRRIGVDHKSLFVPDVTAGPYAIRYEHDAFLQKDFNITVGDGLPTTFTESMEPKTYDMHLILPNPYSLLFIDHNLRIGSDPLKACSNFTFQIRNDCNVPIGAWYKVSVVGGATLYDSSIASLSPGATSEEISNQICADGSGAGNLPIGTHSIKVEIGPTGLPITDTATDSLFVAEWATDVTFIATAPGITDLHGVEVFIDGTSMGTT